MTALATYCQQAVDLARTMDDPAALGHSLNRLGNWQANAGQAEDGIRNHLEALRVFEEANDVHGRAVTLDLLAIGYRLSGDTATALDHYAMAIPLLRSIGDRRMLSSALSTAGGISRGMGVTRSARSPDLPPSLGSSPMVLIQEGAELARSLGWRSGTSYALLLSGIAAVNIGEVQSGLQQLNESVRIAKEISHTQWYVTLIFTSHWRICTSVFFPLPCPSGNGRAEAARTRIQRLADDGKWSGCLRLHRIGGS